MGTTAPYGYVKDPADHNHLLIDDKVAHVVRGIFDLALAGNGIAKIRIFSIFRKMSAFGQVLNPSEMTTAISSPLCQGESPCSFRGGVILYNYIIVRRRPQP